MKSFLRTLVGWLPGLLVAAGVGLTAGTSEAIVLVDSAGFESPTFTTGTLDGQQQWLNAGSGGSTAVVQSSVVKSGSQALQVDRTALSDRFWAKLIAPPPSGRYVSIEWDMLVNATGAATGFGPFFGVNVFDDTIAPIATLAAFGVDATTGDVLIQEGGSGVLITTSAFATNGEWDRFRLELDFGSDTYNAYFNGTLIATTGFVDGQLGIDRLTDADIVAFAAGGDAASQSQVGTAYFDNFIVRDGLRGDYNDNGVVDAADYTVWRDQLGQTAFGLAADGNADGVVDGNDYALWVSTFGDTNAIASNAMAVPEPSGLLIVFSLSLTSATFARWSH